MKVFYTIPIMLIMLLSKCGTNNNIDENNNVNNVDNNKPKELIAVKVQEPAKIDGHLSDAAWINAPQGTDFVDRNMGGEIAEDQSVIMMVYSDKAIYVGWYLFDEEPDQIVANVDEHQIRPWNEDWISFTFDPFHTHLFNDRTFFITNPNGIKFVSHPPPGVPMNEVADLWNIAANIVDDGWVVEMEIPWEMLDYPQVDEPINIGINFDRGHHRTGANTWWSKVGFVEDNRKDGHWVNVQPPKK